MVASAREVRIEQLISATSSVIRRAIATSGVRPVVDCRALTLGIEHEFFLCDRDGHVAELPASQRFLRRIAELLRWTCIPGAEGDAPEIVRVASGETQWSTEIKYEHPPHLMEVAVRPTETVDAQERELRVVFDAIATAADQCGLVARHTPVLDVRADSPALRSDWERIRALRGYRRVWLSSRGGSDPQRENFSAIIAATQIQIGGLPWADEPDTIARLYSWEALASEVTSQGIRTLAQRRWMLYSDSLGQAPLIGFPRTFETWTWDLWVRALIASPLSGPSDAAWLGKTMLELSDPSAEKCAETVRGARDLQVVRPRFHGTVELRGDAAQPSLERILATAALRVGIATGVLLRHLPACDFVNARDQWWRDHEGNGPGDIDLAFVERIAALLHARGYGEERYLNAFST